MHKTYIFQIIKKAGKHLFLILTVVFTHTVSSSHAQTMNILLTNGNSQNYSITSSSKIYFSSSNLVFNNVSSSTPIDQIRKITFTTASKVENVNTNGIQLTLSPNPAKDYIVLSNAPEGKNTISIYSMTGATMLITSLHSSSSTVDISTLPKGMYVVKIQTLTAKFIKL